MKKITIVITATDETVDNATLLQELAAIINETRCAGLNKPAANWSGDYSDIQLIESVSTVPA